MKIENVIFERIIIENDEFPYNENQSNFQVVSKDFLIIETNLNSCFIFTLDNTTIEYSLQISNFKKNDSFILNSSFGIKENNEINHFLNLGVIDILFLHKIDDNEIVSKSNINKSELIGVKFLLENKCEILVYSGEPDLNELNEIKITREGSTICIIFKDFNLIPLDDLEFTHTYRG